MKVAIDVADRKEGELIKIGLDDPVTRALVKVMGALQALPSKRSQERVMSFVADVLAEEAEGK